jgi:hypothetical protein
VHELPAETALARLAAAVARDAMSNPLDSPEFLHMQVQQLSGMVALIAPHWDARLEVPPARPVAVDCTEGREPRSSNPTGPSAL